MPATAEIVEEIFSWGHLEPEPLLSCPQWAEKNIVLSREAGCSDPGPLVLDKIPHMRGPLESFSDPTVEEITLKFSAQGAKTTIIFCMLGYAIDCDPDPAMVVLPKDGNEKTWRDIRFKHLITDSPALKAHTTGKEDDLAGEIFQLMDCFIKFASAGSPSALAETACRYIILDEKNKYPPFSGKESSPSKLAKERAETFYNRKYINASTPTGKDGEISKDYDRSDQRERHVRCPHCKEFQVLTFFKDEKRKTGQIKWPHGSTSDEVRNSQAAWYECGHCEGRIEESQRWPMIRTGVWVQKGATIDKKGNVSGEYYSRHHGYKVWRVYAPFRTFSDIAAEFLASKDSPADLMNFYNSWLCKEWEEMIDKINSDSLYDRREGYGPELPDGTLMLTAWFDTQDDRLEGEIIAWGKDEECWGIEYLTVEGDPGHPSTWDTLDEVLKRTYITSKGVGLRITGAGVDTGGHHFTDVCDFCRPRHRRVNGPRVFATQGASVAANKPLKRLVMEPRKNNKGRVPLYNIDTSSFKKTIFKRVNIKDFGPKYCHFPLSYDETYFQGLVESERLKRTTDKKGYNKIEWVKDPAIRNEPLDVRVGNMAILFILRPNFIRLEEKMKKKILEASQSSEEIKKEPQIKKSFIRSKRGGWVNGWK